jgi:hypothetical protein
MRVLLDTHALVWGVANSRHLSPVARNLTGDPSIVKLVSIGSLWEASQLTHGFRSGGLMLPMNLRITFAALGWMLATASAWPGDPLSDVYKLKPMEVVITPKAKMSGAFQKDVTAVVGPDGSLHYTVQGRFFKPPVDFLSIKEIPGDPFSEFFSQGVKQLKTMNLEGLKQLYDAKGAERLMEITKDPSALSDFTSQYTHMKGYALTLIVEKSGQCVAFSCMTSTDSGDYGYPFLGLTEVNGQPKFAFLDVSDPWVMNIMMGLTYGVLEVKEVK